MTLIEGTSTFVIAEDVSSMKKGEYVSGGDFWFGYNYTAGIKVILQSGKKVYAWEEDGELLLAAWREFCKTRDLSKEKL